MNNDQNHKEPEFSIEIWFFTCYPCLSRHPEERSDVGIQNP